MKLRKRCYSATVLLAAVAGCMDATAPPARLPATGPAAELAQNFDAAATGTLEGRIVWQGPTPTVAEFEVHPDLDSHPNLPKRGMRPNPHAPRVNAQNHGVDQAAVFLRHVELRRSRPWDHEAAVVEHSDWQLSVVQGSVKSSIGFVRRGEAFQTVNRQKLLHILLGDGAAFFSMPLPDPDVVSTRTLAKNGHVELSSGTDCFWMRAHLFVVDHPYGTRSDGDGHFVLPGVPAGKYQVVCWLPNWNITLRERNGESGLMGRIRYCAALEKEADVTVSAGKTSHVDFAVAERDFSDCGRQ